MGSPNPCRGENGQMIQPLLQEETTAAGVALTRMEVHREQTGSPQRADRKSSRSTRAILYFLLPFAVPLQPTFGRALQSQIWCSEFLLHDHRAD